MIYFSEANLGTCLANLFHAANLSAVWVNNSFDGVILFSLPAVVRWRQRSFDFRYRARMHGRVMVDTVTFCTLNGTGTVLGNVSRLITTLKANSLFFEKGLSFLQILGSQCFAAFKGMRHTMCWTFAWVVDTFHGAIYFTWACQGNIGFVDWNWVLCTF